MILEYLTGIAPFGMIFSLALFMHFTRSPEPSLDEPVDPRSCEHEWKFVCTVRAGSATGSKYRCRWCGKTEIEPD